ncbi:MAG: hypothetical protein JNK15_00760 [Planctomycetes bacterium]|nr:hypothetical protein [Planctomycetota bacterium]
MRSPTRTLVLSILPLLAAALPAQKGLAEPRVGLSFQPPKGWGEVPAGTDRFATVRLFAGPQSLTNKDIVHTPVLRVMFFKKGGDDSLDIVDGLPRTTPFRSLEDFAKRGLGAQSVAKDAQKVSGIEGQRIVGKDLPLGRVLLGQTLPLADGEAAVCIDVLANQAEKMKKEIDAVFASLETVPPAEGLHPQPPWVTNPDWTKQDAAARTAAHRQWAEAIVAATTKSPEAGYKVSKSKYWTVLSAADPAFTKKVVTAAEMAREWFAKKLPELTKDAPLPAVLRIVDNTNQYNAWLLARGSLREFDANRRELVVVNDRDNGGATGYGATLRAVLWHLFDDVDPGVLPGMPRWFDNGLWEFLRSSKFDGKKFEFFAGDVEKGRIDYYRQKGEPVTPVWKLMQEAIQPSPEAGKAEDAWGYTPDCARLMRWFWMGDGLKAFDKPTLVADYVKAIGTAYWANGRDPKSEIFGVLTEAQQKDLNSRYYKWRDAVLVGTNNVAVPLQPAAWTALDPKWHEYNKNFK